MTLQEIAWSPGAARQLVSLTCEMTGVEFDPKELQLLRFGTNAVYRLGQTGYVLRIARPGIPLERISREMALARFLKGKNYPAVAPADDISPEPLDVLGAVASFWIWVEHYRGEVAAPDEWGQLLRDFHRACEDYHGYLPRYDPMAYVSEDLVRLQKLGFPKPADQLLLWKWHDELKERLAVTSSALGDGCLHGDPHPGNALVTNSGPVLIDFERLGRGPREWDLVPMTLGFRRFHTPGARGEYARFAQAYGFDVTAWEHYEQFARARELLVTTWRMTVEATARVRPESARRLAYWRGHPSPPAWRAFQ